MKKHKAFLAGLILASVNGFPQDNVVAVNITQQGLDGCMETVMQPTGEAVRIALDPVGDVLTVGLPQPIAGVVITLYAANGTKVYGETLHGKTGAMVNMSAFVAGSYVLTVSKGNALLKEQVVVKE